MDNFLPPLQKNFNEIRDFITDSTLINQLDETISFLIECLNINNGYIFLVLDDQKVVVSPSSSPKYLLPSVFSEFDLAIISKKEICSYSNLQVEISTEKSTKLISYFLDIYPGTGAYTTRSRPTLYARFSDDQSGIDFNTLTLIS